MSVITSKQNTTGCMLIMWSNRGRLNRFWANDPTAKLNKKNTYIYK